MDLKSKLNTAKSMSSDTGVSNRRIPAQNVSTFVGNVDDLTEKVFGRKIVDDGSGNRPYDAKEEMEMLKNGISQENIRNSKLPSVIKESIAANPLISTTVDPKMDAFTQKLATTMGSVSKSTDIINQLDEMDKEKEAKKALINEINRNASVNIDYSLIRTIVEEAVRSVKDEIRNELNESMNRNMSRMNGNMLTAMKMSDKFLFLDSDNNVFECQMVYKGKNKKKS